MIAAKSVAVFTAIVAAAAIVLTQQAASQDRWPSKNIRIVVPVGAGTVTDTAGRLIARHLNNKLGQVVIVENRPGAGATIGAREVARSEPDGYTFLIGGNTTHSAAKSLLKNVPYDPVNDFTPIARVGRLPTLLATNSQQSFKTIQELVEFARTNPGKLSYGHGNALGHVVGETLKAKLKLDIVRVPYASNPPAIVDLISNTTQLMIPDLLSALPLIESGKLVPLAVSERTRSQFLPNTPTMDETVIKGFDVLPWFGVYGPAKLPEQIVERVASALREMSSDPEFISALRKLAVEPYFLAGDEFVAFAKADIGVWESHARVAGIEPQ